MLLFLSVTSDWPINLRMRVMNWPNIFVDKGQFSDPDFISGTHQRENVQFAYNINNLLVYTPWPMGSICAPGDILERLFLSICVSNWACMYSLAVIKPPIFCINVLKCAWGCGSPPSVFIFFWSWCWACTRIGKTCSPYLSLNYKIMLTMQKLMKTLFMVRLFKEMYFSKYKQHPWVQIML